MPAGRPASLRTAIALLTAAAHMFAASPASADATQPPALPDRIIDVVQVGWPGASTPQASAESVARTIQDDTIDRWRNISNGKIVFTFGQVLDPLQTRIQMPCDAAGSIEYMNAVQTAAYQRAGIAKWDSRYLVILSPRPTPDCVWDGRGIVNPPTATSGRLILKDTDDRTVIAHELGHNLGLGHSNYEKCNDGRADGPWEDCTAVEYGSATDLMSNNDRSSTLNAYHQWRMGWIPNTDVAIGNKNMSVNLNPVDTTTGTRALFIRDKTAAYWVEYRKADPENQIDAGIVLYRSDPPPADSVESPIASDKADPTNTNVTTDVWMISLGTYRYSTSNSTGSPSLAAGKLFTTAFGGASIIASLNADGTAAVTVSRNSSGQTTKPPTPQLSDPSFWESPATEILESALEDNGAAITKFEARITTTSGARVVDVASAPTAEWRPTYLNPINPPTTALVRALPEGTYDLQLRAVDAFGASSDWSNSVRATVDLGTPTVTATFRVTPTKSAARLEWIGATDKGSGVCRAQVLNADGFALLSWNSATSQTPTFLTTNPKFNERGLVYDCKGNGVIGDLSLTTRTIKAKNFTRTGNWLTRSNGDLQCTGTCTATLQTRANTSTSFTLRNAGAVTIQQDRRPIKPLKATTNTNTRTVFVASGKHTVTMRGTNIVLTAATEVTSTWTQTATRSFTAQPDDTSLRNETQQALAQLGFSQLDVIDSLTVTPLSGGTGTDQATLDLCQSPYPSDTLRTARRQVHIPNAGSRYVFLSTETVRYQSATAVQQALKELDEYVDACRSNGYSLTATGEKQAHTFLPLPPLPSGLVPESDRRVYLVTIGESSTATTLLAAYQFSGTTLNALYVVVEGANSIDVAEQSRWLYVAAILGQRLRNSAPSLAT